MPSVARRKDRYARQPRVHPLNDGEKRSGRTSQVNLVVPNEVALHIADHLNVLVVKHHGHAQK